MQPRTYLEIGVRTGESLRLAPAKARCIGVDPAPDIPAVLAARDNVDIFALQSDAFFHEYPRASDVGYDTLDIAFIDGMHLSEYVLRDLVNLSRWADPESLLLLHDVLPPTVRSGAREKLSHLWCGDVWRVAMFASSLFPSATLYTLPVSPSGLMFISGITGPPEQARIEAVAERMSATSLEVAHGSLPKVLNVLALSQWRPRRQLRPRGDYGPDPNPISIATSIFLETLAGRPARRLARECLAVKHRLAGGRYW